MNKAPAMTFELLRRTKLKKLINYTYWPN